MGTNAQVKQSKSKIKSGLQNILLNPKVINSLITSFNSAPIQSSYPYSKAFNISSEATKTMNREQMEVLIQKVKDAMAFAPLPVGVHIQWNCDMNVLPRNGDFLMYEYSWHPKYGNDQSVQKVIDESKRVLDLLGPGRVWFQEMNWDPENLRARQQAEAVAALPGIIGLPGPITI